MTYKISFSKTSRNSSPAEASKNLFFLRTKAILRLKAGGFAFSTKRCLILRLCSQNLICLRSHNCYDALFKLFCVSRHSRNEDTGRLVQRCSRYSRTKCSYNIYWQVLNRHEKGNRWEINDADKWRSISSFMPRHVTNHRKAGWMKSLPLSKLPAKVTQHPDELLGCHHCALGANRESSSRYSLYFGHLPLSRMAFSRNLSDSHVCGMFARREWAKLN